MADEKTHWPWQKADDPEPPLAPVAAPRGVFTPTPEPVKHKPVEKHKPAEKHRAAEKPAAPKHEPKYEPKTRVEITGVRLFDGIVTVHGEVHGKQHHVRFLETDLKGIEDHEARKRYVAGQIRSVAEQGVSTDEPPEGLDLLGVVHL